MKKTVIACVIASIFAAGLTGCGKSDEQLRLEANAAAFERIQAAQAQAKQEEAEADQLAAEQAAADEKELTQVIAELKKGDPLIRDAYYGYNEKGDRVLHVIRDNPPQPQQPQYQQGPNGQPVIINNQQPQTASSGSSESIWPLVAGVGGGMLLANAINNSGGYDRYRDSHQPYSSRNWDNDNDYRRERTTVVNQYHTTNVRNVKTAYKTPDSPAAKAFAAQTGYKPAKVAPSISSASSFSQTRTTASPTKQIASKPAAAPQINSYWGSSQKASPAKSAPATASSNSYWGSSSKASPSSSSSSRSSGSSFSSGGSSKSSFSSGSSRSSSSFSSSRSSSSRR